MVFFPDSKPPYSSCSRSKVLGLHHEDHVRPSNVLLGKRYPRAQFCPGRSHFITGEASIHLFSGQASHPVLGANKKQLLGLVHNAGMLSDKRRKVD